MLEDLWKVVRSRMEDGGKDKDEAGDEGIPHENPEKPAV